MRVRRKVNRNIEIVSFSQFYREVRFENLSSKLDKTWPCSYSFPKSQVEIFYSNKIFVCHQRRSQSVHRAQIKYDVL